LAVYLSTDAFEREWDAKSTITVTFVLLPVAASIHFDERMKTIIS